MFSLPILSAALAILISWALFALFCSYLHEVLAQVKAERGRFMRKYLFKQLQDLPNGVNWASMLYLHGTIDLLSREASKPTNDIQPDVFAKTLIEIVGNAHIVQIQLPVLQQNLLQTKNNSGVQPQQFVNAAQNYFSHATLYNFKAATQVLKPGAVVNMLKQAMNNAELKANAGGDAQQWITEAEIYSELVSFIEKWYSDFTGRLSYWYKKKTKERLFILGCLLALFLNIDSIQLFSFYTANPAAREAVINYYAQNADTLNALANRMQYARSTNTDSAVQLVTPSLQPGAVAQMDTLLFHLREQHKTLATEPIVLDNVAARAAADSVTAAKSKGSNAIDTVAKKDTVATVPVRNAAADTLHILSQHFIMQIDSLRSAANLPVGFQYSVFRQPVGWFSYPFLLKLLGILISGLAASFGGPFWFDVLRKIYTRK